MRIAYLATADARGHLMRAQLLTHALQASGFKVQLLTTSDEGERFLAEFGLKASVLSRHYAVQFDAQQNMLREETDANVASYLFHPRKMLRDILKLRHIFRDNDLVLNDSFHPALLLMGCLPIYRRKVVHIYGTSLRKALEGNFIGRVPSLFSGIFSRLVSFQIRRAKARLEHDFAYPPNVQTVGGITRIPTPVEVVRPKHSASTTRSNQVAVYLNPHFCDTALAAALEKGISDSGLSAYLTGEGMAGRPGWVAQDTGWVNRAVASSLIVSAPGMAALSIAKIYDRPILLVLTDQPEQQRNTARALELGLRHKTVVWLGDSDAFTASVRSACDALCANSGSHHNGVSMDGYEQAAKRLDNWVEVITNLAQPERL